MVQSLDPTELVGVGIGPYVHGDRSRPDRLFACVRGRVCSPPAASFAMWSRIASTAACSSVSSGESPPSVSVKRACNATASRRAQLSQLMSAEGVAVDADKRTSGRHDELCSCPLVPQPLPDCRLGVLPLGLPIVCGGNVLYEVGDVGILKG